MKSYRFSFAVLSFLLFVTFNISAQTQLLKEGNASCYFMEPPGDFLNITLGRIDFNGVEYYKRKITYFPWYNPSSGGIRYERIKGDSCYYIRNLNTGSDTLIFNFNWSVGTVIKSDTVSNTIFEERIDSIVVEDLFLPQDTVFYIIKYDFNPITGDTNFYIPAFTRYSRKCGQIDFGILGYMIGVKVDGTRHGTVYPYPEEIYFSADSIYSYTEVDTEYCYLKNSSDYDLIIDTVTSISDFLYYNMNFLRGNDSIKFFFIHRYPYVDPDTLNFPVPAHDSVLLRIDLIEAILGRMEIFFTDTLGYAMHFNGSGFEYSYHFLRRIPISGYARIVGDAGDEEIIPGRMILFQNYPNPFNPVTAIKYSLPERSNVTIKIFDALGREIETLVNEEKQAGTYEILWNSENLPSGIYFYRMSAGNYTETKKMVLLR